MLWHFLTNSRLYQDPNNAHSHVIDGYLIGNTEQAEELGGGGTSKDLLHHVLPAVLAKKNARAVKEFLEEQRRTYQQKY